MAITAWKFYDLAKYNLGAKLIDLTTDPNRMALFASGSNAGTSSVSPATYATLTNEVAAGGGYSTGGVAITPGWANAAGTETFTESDGVWTPTGAGITALYAVIYCSVSGLLICFTQLDAAPVTVATIRSPSGVNTLS